MSEPIVFVSTHKIKEGKLDALKESYQEGTRFMEANKPQTVAFLHYLNEDATEISTVHVFPDAESMELHMEGIGERAGRAAEFLDFECFELYGNPSEAVLEMMARSAERSGVTLNLKPEHLSGYLRLESG
ncbi:MAG: hypothetical protein PVG14_02555 [Anaerolineales bacterium]|jgi:hypothetical protein